MIRPDRLIRGALAGLLTIAILARSVPAAENRPYDFHRSVLANGLTVISLEDHSCPVVAVQLWYHVGSKDENPERQGFAHMFEHMMFRGTDRLGPEDHFELIRRTGGDCNAFTAFDNTTYVNELPANQLDLALWLEAERMAFLKIDEESFHKERAVVEEERRSSSLNTPYGTVPEKVLAEIYRQHPYRWTPIGQIPHLRAATLDELQSFWDTFYVPGNATLVMAGDLKHEDAHLLARKYFAWIPKAPPAPRITVKEPPQTEPRQITIPEKKGPAPIVGLLYRGVPQEHADALPLDLLMSILGGGESSRLYRDIVKEQKIAQAALAGTAGFEDDGLLGAGAVLMPWGDKTKVLETIRAHVFRIREEGVTQRELEKVRNQRLSAEVVGQLTVASKASLLGRYQALEDDADLANRQFERIRSITREDLHRVAKLYLVPERETAGVVQPEIGGVLKSLLGGKGNDLDEGAAPVSAPATNRVAKRGGVRADLRRPAGFPTGPPKAPLLSAIPKVETHEKALGNGLRVVVVPNHEVPFVSLTCGILHGGWTESKPGTAAMAAAMVTQGTLRHTAAELAEELEFNAIELGGSASIDVASVSAGCVSNKFEVAMRYLAEVVREPTFPGTELEILRQQQLLGLMVQAKTPEYVADRELRQRLFGSHPYARTPGGEPGDVQALNTNDLKQWWGARVRPAAAVLYIAGDVRPETAFETAAKVFGDWRMEGEQPVPVLPAVPEPEATRIYLVDQPGSVQSQIRLGHLGIARREPDYFTGLVLSQVFGGSFSSRLNRALRVEKGLTYGAGGGFGANRFAGTFRVSTFTKTPSTGETLGVILREIDRIRSSPPESEELEAAKSYLVGRFAGDRETPGQMAGDLWFIDYAGLPRDYFQRYLAGVRNASAESIHSVAEKRILPGKLTIVVVGDAAQIRTDLESIAPVTVVGSADP